MTKPENRPPLIPSGIPFTQFPNEAITDPALTVAARSVLMYLFMLSNSEGRAWPSQRTIASEIGISHNSVLSALKLLDAEGWVTRTSMSRSPDSPIEHRQRHMYTIHGTRPRRLFDPAPTRNMNRREIRTGSLEGQTDAEIEPAPTRNPRHTNTHNKHLDKYSDGADALSTSRKRDLLWEAVVEIHGEPATDSERGKLNRAVGDLRKADVTPDEYPQLVAAFTTKHSRPNQASLQPTAITIATRIGELRHFIRKGPIGVPLGTLDSLVAEQKRQQDVAALEARYGQDGTKNQRMGETSA